jgi:hypothetical protein
VKANNFCFVFSPFELRIVILIVLVLIISCCRNSCALTVCFEQMHYGMLLSILSLIPVSSFLQSQLILLFNADDNATQAMDVDQEDSDHSRQVVKTEVEVINLESDEDEDLPTVQDKAEGKAMHPPRAMNSGNIHIAQSVSASPATLHAQGGMNGVVPPEPAPATMNGVPQSELLRPALATVNGVVPPEQHEPAPATMNGILQPELRQPASATTNGAVSPEQHEPALAPMNGVLHPEQRRPEPVRAAENRVSPQALLWHYIDPQGDARGPFALLHLLRWKQNGFFSEGFRVWRTGQAAEQAILLNDAFRMHM